MNSRINGKKLISLKPVESSGVVVRKEVAGQSLPSRL
jgi:hypothetical protein